MTSMDRNKTIKSRDDIQYTFYLIYGYRIFAMIQHMLMLRINTDTSSV